LKYGNILQIFPKKKEIPHRLYPFFKETILYIHKKALWRTTGLGEIESQFILKSKISEKIITQLEL
jgi:hypothetical protein